MKIVFISYPESRRGVLTLLYVFASKPTALGVFLSILTCIGVRKASEKPPPRVFASGFCEAISALVWKMRLRLFAYGHSGKAGIFSQRHAGEVSVRTPADHVFASELCEAISSHDQELRLRRFAYSHSGKAGIFSQRHEEVMS